EEAAMIDGCTRFGSFIRVGLPCAKPGMIAVGTMVGITAWKEFMFASILLTSDAKKVVSIGLTSLVGIGSSITYVNLFMTAAVYACIPILVVFLIFQKQMISGLAKGAVK
ncbi:MAG: ABC transporter permease subunit, partial [Halanaerobiaceae bacterium]